MSNPFTYENHLKFMAERKRLEDERIQGNVVTLDEDPAVRALRRLMTLREKYKGDMDKAHAEMPEDQLALADQEFVSRAGDPNRYNEETGGWVIWP